MTPVAALERLPGGASSHTFLATTATSKLVVKVAPPGLEPVRNRDVLRQARALDALAATGVPVPVVVARDAAAPPLFVMTHVAGDSVEPLFDISSDGSAAELAARFHAAARVLRRLHDVDPPDGEPVVTPADEVARWAAALQTVDPPYAPGWEAARDALRRDVPVARPPVLSHGDFRLGNMLAVGTEIAAVIDWEIWTVADPRVDLAWLRLQADPSAYRRPTPFVGHMPTPDELAATYGGDVGDLAWFDALARFKAVAIWSLILKHGRRSGGTPFDEVATALPGMLAASFPT